VTDEPRFLGPGPLPFAGPDFEVVAALGRVGDGLVYAARDGGRQARLREYAPAWVVARGADGTLHPTDARLAPAWEEATTRFLDKGHKLAAFDHPGVAPLWRAIALTSNGARQGAYLVGAPAGEPLGAVLAGGLRLAPDRVMALAADLADVLSTLHARGLTHLDISPATVTIASGRLQLTDFAVDNRPFMALLETQAGLVRPGYSPIEHHDASMADPLGPRADVFGASALLFRLITGRDPASWQERWRDPSASRLDDSEAFPPRFIAAIREGMAIEPDERFPNGAAWREAMALPEPEPMVETIIIRPQGEAKTVVAPALDAPVQPPPPPPAPPPPQPPEQPPHFASSPPPASSTPPAEPAAPAPAGAAWVEPAGGKRNWLLPVLLALGLLVIAAGAYLAYTQNWFVPAEDERATANESAAEEEDERSGVGGAPLIQPGSTVSGQLTASDNRRGGGQFEDRFTLEGRQGDRVEISLNSSEFDPLLTVTGNGLEEANDDDEARGTRNSRLLLTLPRTGRYTVSVSSYQRGGTGSYFLEVQNARPAISIAVPAVLAGRWREAADAGCSNPVIITIEGDELVFRSRGNESRQQIMDGVGRTIRTRPSDAAADEPPVGYRLSEDGDRFELGGTAFVRC